MALALITVLKGGDYNDSGSKRQSYDFSAFSKQSSRCQNNLIKGVRFIYSLVTKIVIFSYKIC